MSTGKIFHAGALSVTFGLGIGTLLGYGLSLKDFRRDWVEMCADAHQRYKDIKSSDAVSGDGVLKNKSDFAPPRPSTHLSLQRSNRYER